MYVHVHHLFIIYLLLHAPCVHMYMCTHVCSILYIIYITIFLHTCNYYIYVATYAYM
jgi:hypothetical protein